MKDKVNKIINGDCIEEMKKLTENSIDTIITDPPAGISFMGKSWDSDKGGRDKWIEWLTEVMKECYRVAKPGSTALVWAIPRTSHWTATAIENTGWQIKDIIMHIFGSGFPKSTDISQTLDKQECRKQFEVRIGRSPTKEEFRKEWEGFRKVVGKQKLQGTARRMKGGNYGDFSGPDTADEIDITEPATPEAKLWNGWKSHGLKPAYEPILVAVKPNEGTYANNALKHGVAGLNIDGGRIDTSDEDFKSIDRSGNARPDIRSGKYIGPEGYNGVQPIRPEGQGRFPANIILDEKAGKMLDEQSGILKSGALKPYKENHQNASSYRFEREKNYTSKRNKGGASRFFYTAKASKAERNLGCEGLETKQTTGGGGGIGDYKDDVNSASGKYGSEKAPATNNHPTVKPLKLMEYLCTLTKTPTGGIVLDPFAGSFTTGIACINTDRDFIGIEKEIEYVRIGKARMKKALADKKEKDRQSLLPY